jgi:hypothetical protein
VVHIAAAHRSLACSSLVLVACLGLEVLGGIRSTSFVVIFLLMASLPTVFFLIADPVSFVSK